MNFHGFARIIGLSSTVWLAGAAPEPAVTAELKAPGPSLDALIQDLANEKYRVREEASRKLWEAGEPALAELEAAADGKDPERAYRARELIRKIQLHITPDTDPAVIDLVERYSKASQTEKINLFGQMFRRRAWRQILKLHANERNPEFQARLRPSASSWSAGPAPSPACRSAARHGHPKSHAG